MLAREENKSRIRSFKIREIFGFTRSTLLTLRRYQFENFRHRLGLN